MANINYTSKSVYTTNDVSLGLLFHAFQKLLETRKKNSVRAIASRTQILVENEPQISR